MSLSLDAWNAYLLDCLRRVQRDLGWEMRQDPHPNVRFADCLDSMGMVEFLMILAEACGVPASAIEQGAGRQFSTIAELAEVLVSLGLSPGEWRNEHRLSVPQAAVEGAVPSLALAAAQPMERPDASVPQTNGT